MGPIHPPHNTTARPSKHQPSLACCAVLEVSVKTVSAPGSKGYIGTQESPYFTGLPSVFLLPLIFFPLLPFTCLFFFLTLISYPILIVSFFLLLIFLRYLSFFLYVIIGYMTCLLLFFSVRSHTYSFIYGIIILHFFPSFFFYVPSGVYLFLLSNTRPSFSLMTKRQ